MFTYAIPRQNIAITPSLAFVSSSRCQTFHVGKMMIHASSAKFKPV